MPTVTVPRSHLFACLGKSFTDDEFGNLCFEYGIELDDVTTEKEMMIKQNVADSKAAEAETADEIVYKIEIPANRYDLLCLEGIVSALRVFLGLSPPPHYQVLNPTNPQYKIIQKKETSAVREYVVGAVLRNITFTSRSYKSFMDLQEKLHFNIGRKRTLASVGTHDLDTIKGPFCYEAKEKESIKFIALRENKSMNVVELFNHYKQTPNCPLAPFLFITEQAPLHPVITDSNRIVCSLPPIINGEHSKITLNTKNVLIECTGTDRTKVNIVLNTVIAMFSEYCEDKYTVESLEVINEADGSREIYPQLKGEEFKNISVEYVNSLIGIKMSGEEICSALNRMQLKSTLNAEGTAFDCETPCTRSDILHPIDIIEDVAISYGYNKITKTLPSNATIARQNPLNKLTDLIRGEIAQCNFTEVLTWALCSHSDNYEKLNRVDKGKHCVRVGNPKTAEFEIVRTSILPGLFKALASNKGHVNLPISLFEISDVCVQTEEKDVGAKNNRQCGALYCGPTSGFEIIHSLLDRIMVMNNYVHSEIAKKQEQERERVRAEADKIKAAKEKESKKNKGKKGKEAVVEEKENNETEEGEGEESSSLGNMSLSRVYSIRPSEDTAYFPGRCGDVYVGDKKIGTFGIVHPHVLKNYDISYPCSALELDIETFLNTQ